MSNGTIDITDLVKLMTTTSIDIEVGIVMADLALIPVVGPFLVGPVIGVFTKEVVTKIISKLMNGARQQVFFFNTAVRKASQAHDFVDAANKLATLPETASDDEYKNAEVKRASYFTNLVLLTN